MLIRIHRIGIKRRIDKPEILIERRRRILGLALNLIQHVAQSRDKIQYVVAVIVPADQGLAGGAVGIDSNLDKPRNIMSVSIHRIGIKRRVDKPEILVARRRRSLGLVLNLIQHIAQGERQIFNVVTVIVPSDKSLAGGIVGIDFYPAFHRKSLKRVAEAGFEPANLSL